jgi:polar amino acid transport system substrate-binding protein
LRQLAALLLALCSCAAFCKPLQIVCDEEKRGSYLVELTAAAFKRVGYEAQFTYVPWSRALNGTMQGAYPVLMAARYTDERAKAIAYSDSIATVDFHLWGLRGNPTQFRDIDDLRPYLIGVIRGSTVTPEFDKAAQSKLRIDYTESAEANIKHLLTGRIDYFIEKTPTIDKLLATTFASEASKIVRIDPPITRTEFFNGFARAIPGHEKLLADFNRGLKLIRADGTEKAILKQYGVADRNE